MEIRGNVSRLGDTILLLKSILEASSEEEGETLGVQ